MASLLEVAELAYNQVFPNPSAQTPIDKEEFIATAKTEYAIQIWTQSKNEKNQEGMYNVPSVLLTEKKFNVENDEIDISKEPILRALSNDMWLQNVGGIACSCTYIKSNVNHAQLFCDDDSIGSMKTYYVIGDKIRFPKGVHKSPLTIIYANQGENVEGDIVIEDMIAGVIRTRLIEIYTGKTGKEDVTNNQNSNS